MAIRTEGADDFDQIARALREADKDLKRKTTAAMRKAAKPAGLRTIEKASEAMPRRGGFADYLQAQGRVGFGTSLRDSGSSLSMLLRHKGVDLRRLERGILRHPVFGNRDVWATTKVPAGEFGKAFEQEVPPIRQAVLDAAQDVLDDVARKA